VSSTAFVQPESYMSVRLAFFLIKSCSAEEYRPVESEKSARSKQCKLSKIYLNAMFVISGILRILNSIRLGARDPIEPIASLESQ
jgi:hypothetical protein